MSGGKIEMQGFHNRKIQQIQAPPLQYRLIMTVAINYNVLV
jgi:hypothetical protein